MTIRHLKVFIKVCECGFSISKASDELNVAQPSVSQTIKELENYYGVILFNRVNRKLILTEEGEILLYKAKEAISHFDEFEKLANNKELNPVVKIGSTMSVGAQVLPIYAKLLKERHPKIEPKFLVEKSSALEQKLLLGELDFAFIEGTIKNAFLSNISIGQDELIAICSIDYQAPSKMRITDLVNYPLLLREKDNPARRMLDYQLGVKGQKIVSPLLVSISNNSIISMATNGVGIGVLPEPITRRRIKEGKIRKIELDTPLKRKIYLVTHKNKVMNSNVEKAYNFAKEIIPIYRKEKDFN